MTKYFMLQKRGFLSIGLLTFTGLMIFFQRNIALADVEVISAKDEQEIVRIQEWIWQQELKDKIDAAEKAMLDAAAQTNAGATQAQKNLFDHMMDDLGNKWAMEAPAGTFPTEQYNKLTEAQKKAFKDAYDDVVRIAKEEAERQLEKVGAEATKKVGPPATKKIGDEVTKKVGGVVSPESGSKTVIREPGAPLTGAGERSVNEVGETVIRTAGTDAGTGSWGFMYTN